MKKIIFLFFLFIFLINIKALDTLETFNHLDDDLNNFNIVYLDLSNLYITTKEYEILKDLKVIGVYIDINNLNKKYFKTTYYEFKKDNINLNMQALNNYYFNILDINHLNKTSFYVNGVKIKKAKVYISKQKLKELLKNTQIDYEIDLN